MSDNAAGGVPLSLLGARLVADELALRGIAGVCIAPGSRSTPLALAFAEQEGTPVFSHLDERCAGFFALGLAKAARKPAVLVCTSGTAAANFYPAIIEAAQSAVPLIVLSADRPPELRDCGANQTIDQARLYGPYAKFFADVGLPIDDAPGHLHLRRIACRAHAEANGVTAGPVQLNCPYREPLSAPPDRNQELPADLGQVECLPLTAAPTPVVAPPAEAIDALARRLACAHRPLLLAGPMAPDAGRSADAAQQLAVRLGAPLLAEPSANLGVAAGAGAEFLVDASDALARGGLGSAQAPDLVVRLGATLTSKAWGQALASWRAVPQAVLALPGSWPDASATADTMLHGEIAATLDALCGSLDRLAEDQDACASRRAWTGQWLEAGARVRDALDGVVRDSAPFEGGVIHALSRVMPHGSRLFVGNSLAVRALDLFWPKLDREVAIHVSRGASGIDGLVSTTFGIAAAGDAPTVGLIGDVSLLHDVGGLLAARRTRARATLVVLDNDGGGIFDHLPVAGQGHSSFEELFTTPHGLDLSGVARAFGVAAITVGVGDLEKAVADSLQVPHTTLIRVPIDRAASHAVHRSVVAVAGGASGWS